MIDRVAVRVLAEAEREVLMTEEEETEKCIRQLATNVVEIAKCRFSLMEVNQCIVRVVFKKIRVILTKKGQALAIKEFLAKKKLTKINLMMCWFQSTPSWKEF